MYISMPWTGGLSPGEADRISCGEDAGGDATFRIVAFARRRRSYSIPDTEGGGGGSIRG